MRQKITFNLTESQAKKLQPFVDEIMKSELGARDNAIMCQAWVYGPGRIELRCVLFHGEIIDKLDNIFNPAQRMTR